MDGPDTVASLYHRDRSRRRPVREPDLFGNTETEEMGHVARALHPSARRSIGAAQIGIKGDSPGAATNFAPIDA